MNYGVIAIARESATTASRRPGRWLRLLGFLCTCMLTCLLFGWLGIQAAYPFVLAAKLRSENDDVEREMHRYRLQNQRVQKEIKALGTRDGVIRAARRHGWVLPGETRLHIPDASPATQ